MALPKLLQKLFQNDGVGPLLRSDILPIKTVNGKEPDSDGNIAAGDALNAEILAAAEKALSESVAETGGTTTADLLSAVSQVEANLDTKLENSTVHIVETWSADDGPSWYRKWSDGWIEQGGNATVSITAGGFSSASTTITLPTAFSGTKYYVGSVDNNDHLSTSVATRNTSTMVLRLTARASNSYTAKLIVWYACGY